MDNDRRAWRMLFAAILLTFPCLAWALYYPLPAPGNDIVGELQVITVKKGDTLTKIGKRYNIGLHELVEANPGVNPWRPKRGSEIVVPTQFVLPPPPREGIIINLAELRLYYFPANSPVVYTYPVGIGRVGWRTPNLQTKVIEKEKDPSWHVPKSIKEHAWFTKGKILPDVVPPGPKNPLGKYALRLGERSYLIHGTNAPWSVGRRVSSGCIRLHADNIKELFDNVPIDTPARVVNLPHKVGWSGNNLFLEAHLPLSDDDMPDYEAPDPLMTTIERAGNHRNYMIDWERVEDVSEQQNGIPEYIGREKSFFFSENQ